MNTTWLRDASRPPSGVRAPRANNVVIRGRNARPRGVAAPSPGVLGMPRHMSSYPPRIMLCRMPVNLRPFIKFFFFFFLRTRARTAPLLLPPRTPLACARIHQGQRRRGTGCTGMRVHTPGLHPYATAAGCTGVRCTSASTASAHNIMGEI